MDADPAPAAPRRPFLVRELPNALTLVRLVLGLAFPAIPAAWRLGALLLATATEFLDGWLARLLEVRSVAGRVLDPIADKLLVFTVLATLLADGTIRPWQLVLVAARDILVAAGAAWVALRRGPAMLKAMPPNLLGKLATAAQLFFFLAVVATRSVNPLLLALTAALSAAAGVVYLARFPKGP